MASQDLPIYQRQVEPKATEVPNFQESINAYAESSNNLSAIGAKVAQSSSNALATQLGYQEGKTPHGDLTPPITEFDKNFADSYHAQAGATLSLQGQKLLDDAQIEMAKPARLTPDLIARTTQQLQSGLNKIADAAPTAIKGQLQSSFDSQVLNHHTQYTTKMLSEQREDQKNVLINSLDLNAKNALELAKSGDIKGANNLVDASKKMAASAANDRFLTPEQARIAHETVQQSALDGEYTYRAMQAQKAGKYAEFEKHYAENKPANMTNEQWLATGHAFSQQISFLQSLQQQDENLKAQQMLNRIASSPSTITGTEWQTFADSVSPLKAEEVKFKYIQALKSHQSATIDADDLVKNYSNPEIQANASDKVKNAAFYKQVQYALTNTKNSANPLSYDEAQVQVAASAGAKVPVFIAELKNKLHSSNPAYIESAAQQIHQLQSMQAGHALEGLNDQDHALYTTFESLRDSRDPVTAARDATEAVLNQDPEVQQANKQKWANYLSTSTSGGIPQSRFALTKFGLSESLFINPSMAQVYGSDILKKYSSLYQIANGDDNVARKLTQKYVDDNYGETGINGGKFTTMHPLEKVLGFQSKDAVPFIQQDVINQINEKLLSSKQTYADKKSNEYWETLPLTNQKHGIFSTSYDPVQVKRHMRTESGEKTDTFNVILQGNAFDNWDVAIQTETGMRNLFQFAPYLGVINYKPNVKAIRDSYNKAHPLK